MIYTALCDHDTIDAYVNLDKKENSVIVRIAEGDINKLDTSTGIFKNAYESSGSFRDYTVVSADAFSLNSYVEMEARAKNDGYTPVWKQSNDARPYSQQTFYFETKDQNEDNIITLSCEKADSRKYSLVGTAHYSEIALTTGIEGEVWRLAAGLYVSMGKTVFGMSDDSGSFSTIPVCGIKGCSVIYKTEGSGRVDYATAVLTDIKTREIDNGRGGKDTVNAVSIGDIKTAAADSSAPYASAFTAVNMQGVASGNIALIDDNLTFMTATVMNNGSKYTDSDGRERTEKVKKVEFVIFDAINYNAKAVYAYTIDLDDNIDTMADREVYVQLYDFEEHKTYKSIRITDNRLEDTSPQLIFDNGLAYLFWREGKDTIIYISISNLVDNGLEEDGTLKDQTSENVDYEMESSVVFVEGEDENNKPSFTNYKVFVDYNDNMFIAWTQGVEKYDTDGKYLGMSQEICASSYIREKETTNDSKNALEACWSRPVRLTDNGMYNDGIAVCSLGVEDLMVVNNCFELDLDAPDGENVKDVSLIATQYKTVGSAGIKDVIFEDKTPLAGSADTVTINVENDGLKPMEGFVLKAYEVRNGVVSDTPVFETRSDERVVPSSVVPVRFDWQMPDSFDGITELSLYITVKEKGYHNISEFMSDSIEIKREYAMRNIRTFQTTEGIYVAYEIENTGNVDWNEYDFWDGESGYSGDMVIMDFEDSYNTGSEQAAAMLYRYASFKGHDASENDSMSISSFGDFTDISEYAVSPMQWSCENGIISGFEDNTLRPRFTTTRAQLAAILGRTASLLR